MFFQSETVLHIPRERLLRENTPQFQCLLIVYVHTYKSRGKVAYALSHTHTHTLLPGCFWLSLQSCHFWGQNSARISILLLHNTGLFTLSPVCVSPVNVWLLTSKLLFPVAGDFAALGFDGLFAVGAGACALSGAQAAVTLISHTHAPLPLTTVWFTLFLTCQSRSTHSFIHTPYSCMYERESVCVWVDIELHKVIKYSEGFYRSMGFLY